MDDCLKSLPKPIMEHIVKENLHSFLEVELLKIQSTTNLEFVRCGLFKGYKEYEPNGWFGLFRRANGELLVGSFFQGWIQLSDTPTDDYRPLPGSSPVVVWPFYETEGDACFIPIRCLFPEATFLGHMSDARFALKDGWTIVDESTEDQLIFRVFHHDHFVAGFETFDPVFMDAAVPPNVYVDPSSGDLILEFGMEDTIELFAVFSGLVFHGCNVDP